MQLKDIKDTFGGFQAGAWISPDGNLLSVQSTHIDTITKHPEKFGTTFEHIKYLHDQYGEQIGQEGEARELVITEVLKNGWIRIRRYRNYWSFTVWDLGRMVKTNIQKGVRALVKSGAMDKVADIKLLVIKTDNLIQAEADDIMKGQFNESLETNNMKIAKFADLPNIPVNLVESSLSRIHAKMNQNDIGAISAFRSTRTYDENMKLHRALRAKLVSIGYDVTEVVGSYIENYESDDAKEVREMSLFVSCGKTDCSNLEADLIKYGEQLDQDSILYKPAGEDAYLYGTNHTSEFPGYGNKVAVGKPAMGKLSQFMSRVRNRPFTFESVKDIAAPETRNGKWAMLKEAELLKD